MVEKSQKVPLKSVQTRGLNRNNWKKTENFKWGHWGMNEKDKGRKKRTWKNSLIATVENLGREIKTWGDR